MLVFVGNGFGFIKSMILVSLVKGFQKVWCWLCFNVFQGRVAIKGQNTKGRANVRAANKSFKLTALRAAA